MASIQKRFTKEGKKIAAQRGKDKVPPKYTRWTMRVFLGRDAEGKRKFVVRTFRTKTEAKAEAERLQVMKRDGLQISPIKTSLSKYLQTWLDARESQLLDGTIMDYRGMVRRYIQEPPNGMPHIGFVQLNQLAPQAFEAVYTYMWKDMGLSPRTIRYLHTVLRQALGHAVLTGSLPRNPTDGVRPPSRARESDSESRDQEKRVNAMNGQQAAAFLEAAQGDRYHALWAVLLMGGLRPGEALGLMWEDVDLDGGKIHVRQSLTRRGVKGWKLKPPKTDQGRRVVVLPAVAVQALRRWRAEQAAERLKLGAEYNDRGFVFASEFGEPLDGSNLAARNFKRILKAAKLGTWEGEGRRRRFRPAFRMYDLRHTCATLLLLDGENPKIVSERLGHASITLTLDTYSHVLPDMQESAADRLEARFGTGA